MSRLDPGYSSWRGAVLKQQNYAQLQLLKLQLAESVMEHCIDSLQWDNPIAQYIRRVHAIPTHTATAKTQRVIPLAQHGN